MEGRRGGWWGGGEVARMIHCFASDSESEMTKK